MSLAPETTTGRRGRRPLVAVCLWTLGIAVALLSAKATVATHLRHRQTAIDAADLAVWAQAQDARAVALSLGGASAVEVGLLMARFGPAVTTPGRPADHPRRVYASPGFGSAAGWRATFDFHGGAWGGRVMHVGFEPSPDPAQVRLSTTAAAVERTRTAMMAITAIFAGTLALTALLTPAHRRSVSTLAKSAAVLCLTATALSDRPAQVLQPIGPVRPFALPTGLLTAGGLLRAWPTRRRPPRGRCVRCGYDLTGNASGVCPECGTPVPRLPDLSPAARALTAMTAEPTASDDTP